MDFGSIFRRGPANLQGSSSSSLEEKPQYMAPRGVSAEGKRAWEVILGILNAYDAGPVRFKVFTAAAPWDESVLSVAFRDPFRAFFEYDSEMGHLQEAMRHELDKAGFFSVVEGDVVRIYDVSASE